MHTYLNNKDNNRRLASLKWRVKKAMATYLLKQPPEYMLILKVTHNETVLRLYTFEFQFRVPRANQFYTESTRSLSVHVQIDSVSVFSQNSLSLCFCT